MIEAHADVRGFFHERLNAALDRHRHRAAEPTQVYLVHLLADVAETQDAVLLDRPLALQLADAMEVSGRERLRRCRVLGDTSLAVGGLFVEQLDRRGVTLEYVASLGGRGYRTASDLARFDGAGGAMLSFVCDDLATNFGLYLRVLDDVKESTALRTPQDIVRLYERWRRGGSLAIAERLQGAGVFPQVEALLGRRGLH